MLPVASLMLCLLAAANLYIVVAQDVVIVAVVLEAHVLVETSNTLLLAIPTRSISTYVL